MKQRVRPSENKTFVQPFVRPLKPRLSPQVTTLWDYPSQHYGREIQGDQKYLGATPSYVIWNVITRYTKPHDLVVDPFCGSGTTIDVAKDTQRRARGFDLSPFRNDIEYADARALPLVSESVDLCFMDPPYGDHIRYSEHERCIGKLSAYDPRYFQEMHKAIKEAFRILKPEGVMALYACDYFEKKKRFSPLGFGLFSSIMQYFEVMDIVCVTRRNKALNKGNYLKAAEEHHFFLRGFNYLFLAKKVAKMKSHSNRTLKR